MTPRWQMLGLFTVLAAALAVAPARAADPELSKLSDSQKLDRLLDQVRDLRSAVTSLESLRTEITGLETRTDLKVQGINDRINQINDRIRRLEGDIEGLRGQLSAATTRTSGFAGPAAPPPATGTIRLRNTFPNDMSIVVNSISYQLAPGETRDIPAQPAGPFTYEVLGVQPRKTVALDPGQTFTITVYPR